MSEHVCHLLLLCKKECNISTLVLSKSELMCHFLLLRKKECNMSTPTQVMSKSERVCHCLLLRKKECNMSTPTPVLSKSKHVCHFLLLRNKSCNMYAAPRFGTLGLGWPRIIATLVYDMIMAQFLCEKSCYSKNVNFKHCLPVFIAFSFDII